MAKAMRVRRGIIGAGVLAASLVSAGAARGADREAVGVFRDWAAFREGGAPNPSRCFAIAEPPKGTKSAGRGAFASVASWPARRVRAQLSIHLSRPTDGKAPVTLTVGGTSRRLIVHDRDAWAPDRRTDALIVSAMRSGSSMSVSGVGDDGEAFADAYRLHGAASAIDAASLACPLLR